MLSTALIVSGCARTDPINQSTTGSTTGSKTTTTTTLSTGSSVLPAPDPEPVRWHDCAELSKTLSCAEVSVPLDYTISGGESTSISLAMAPATNQAAKLGTLIFNPGGPGIPATAWMAESLGVLSDHLRSRFDVVAFDPRGVGASDAIDCHNDSPDSTSTDPDPDTPQEVNSAMADAQTWFDYCSNRVGLKLAKLGTVNVARDVEQIRKALGQEKIWFFGLSWGTSIGLTYAAMFPGRLAALALDGPVAASTDPLAFARAQANGYETALNGFIDWCASTSCEIDPAGENFDRLRSKTQSGPIPTSDTEVANQLSDQWLISITLSAMFQQRRWPQLANGMARALEGDGAALLSLAKREELPERTGYEDNFQEVNTAVTCTDAKRIPTLSQVEDNIEQIKTVAPRLGPIVGWWQVACVPWDLPIDPMPAPTAPQGVTTLIVGTTRDPATPYQWAADLHQQLQPSALVTRDGDGHTGYAWSSCVSGHVDAYLIDGTVPPEGTTCND